ncbi:peptidase S24-like protein [Acetobacteraceae bacterium AT-5844]|nr:peptidase S24-like protein [Acetobacteraceae bacterium AT-5844]
MSQPQISRLETGTRRLKVDQAVAIARALGVKPQDLLVGNVGFDGDLGALEPNATIIPEPVSLQSRPMGAMDVPVYGRAQGGDDGFFEINLAEGPLEYVERPASLANVKEVFAILVHGTSMDPVWIPDDIVYVVPSRPVKPGDYVVVQIERGPGQQPASLLKRFCRRDNNRVVLEQHNPQQQVTLPRDQVKEMWRALHWREVK